MKTFAFIQCKYFLFGQKRYFHSINISMLTCQWLSFYNGNDQIYNFIVNIANISEFFFSLKYLSRSCLLMCFVLFCNVLAFSLIKCEIN